MELADGTSAGRRAQADRRRAAMAGGTCPAARRVATDHGLEAGVATEVRKRDTFQGRLHRLATCREVRHDHRSQNNKLWLLMHRAVYVMRRGSKAACCCYIIIASKGCKLHCTNISGLVVRRLGVEERKKFQWSFPSNSLILTTALLGHYSPLPLRCLIQLPLPR